MGRYGDYFRELRAKETGNAVSISAKARPDAAGVSSRTNLAVIDAQSSREGTALRQLAGEIAARQTQEAARKASPVERLADSIAADRQERGRRVVTPRRASSYLTGGGQTAARPSYGLPAGTVSAPMRAKQRERQMRETALAAQIAQMPKYPRSMDGLNSTADTYKANHAPALARVAAGAKSIGHSLAGSVPALAELAGQYDTNRRADLANPERQALLKENEVLSNRLTAIRQGYGNAAWGSEADIRAQMDASTRRLRGGLRASDTASPDGFGMRQMRRSAEQQEQALAGMTGVPRFLAGTGLSIANNAPALATGAVFGPAASMALMGAQAAASKGYELNERGLSPEESLVRGLASGGIEALTEKYSIEGLWDIAKGTGAKTAVKNLLRQAGVEASEESASYALNYLTDKLARDPEAEFSLAELAESAAGGALSGGVYGGVGLAVNRLGTNGQKNYQFLRERDSGKTPDFDAQHAHYYNAARSGMAVDKIPAYPSETPLDRTAQQAAAFAGQNDGLAEARETVRNLADGKAVSDLALDRALSFPETRKAIAEQVGALPGTSSQARKAVRDWAAARKQPRAGTVAAADGIAGEQRAPGLAETDVSRRLKAEDREFIDTLFQAVGLRGAIVSRTSDMANAQIENGVVTVYANADDAASAYRGTVRHEVTHQIKALGAEHYQAFEDFAVTARAARDGVSVESLVESTRETYRTMAGQELTEAQAREELAGDFAMLLNVDTDTVRRFVGQGEQNRQTAKGILQTIRDIISRIRERFANRKLSQEQRAFLRQMQKGEKLWAEALGEASRIANKNTAQTDGGTRFSIKVDANGELFVDVDRDVLGDLRIDTKHITSDDKSAIQNRLNAFISQNFNELIELGEQKVGINSTTAKEWVRSDSASFLKQRAERRNDPRYIDKMRAFANADEIIKAAGTYESEALKHERKKKDFVGFQRGKVRLRVGDAAYEAEVVIGVTPRGAANLYDIVRVEPIMITEAPKQEEASKVTSAPQNGTNHRFETSSDTSIADVKPEVNENLSTRYSIKRAADGELITVIDCGQEVFRGKPVRQYAAIARNVLREKFVGKTLPLSDSDLARFKKRQEGEYAYPSKFLSDSSLEYEAKMRASTELEHLLLTAQYSHHAEDTKNHPEATLGFDYYQTRFIVGGHLFEGLINIANSEKHRIFYDITKIKEIPDISGKYATLLAQSTSTFGNLSNDIIRRKVGQTPKSAAASPKDVINTSITDSGTEVNENLSTRYSIKRAADGSQYVEVDTDILEGVKERSSVMKNELCKCEYPVKIRLY